MRTSLVWKSTYGLLIGVLAIVLSFSIHMATANDESDRGSEFASFESCVYDNHTGRPIPGARVAVQSLGGANASAQYTLSDGCIGDNLFNVDRFSGDYIEAEFEHDGKLFTQQFRIPNTLLPQVYRRDFHLDIPRRRGGARSARKSPPETDYPNSSSPRDE